jgi:hypothetical protein
MSQPTDEEVLQSIRRIYLLGKAFNAEAIWLRDYLKQDYIKPLNDAKAKVNFFTTKASSNISLSDRAIMEEKGYQLLDRLFDEFKYEPNTK